MTDEDATRPKTAPNAAATAGNGVDTDPAGATAAAATADEVARLETELAELKDRWLRERADFENFKRRAVREKQDALRFGSEHLLRDILPVIDNLNRALSHAKADDPIVEGIALVLRGFDEVLERHGVRLVPARGLPFDPNRHEAISHVESEAPANTVIDEHQRGYMLHDRLLRPSQVTVGKGPKPDADVAKDSGDA